LKKCNERFDFHPCSFKTILVLFALIVFFTIHAQPILASPLNYVLLDHWVYPAISRLETLRVLDGNDTIATNTLPLSRIEIAYLIDAALSNIQKGKIECKDSDLTLMEKLILEFQEELTSIDAKIISINSDTASSDPTATLNTYQITGSTSLFLPRGLISFTRIINQNYFQN